MGLTYCGLVDLNMDLEKLTGKVEILIFQTGRGDIFWIEVH